MESVVMEMVVMVMVVLPMMVPEVRRLVLSYPLVFQFFSSVLSCCRIIFTSSLFIKVTSRHHWTVSIQLYTPISSILTTLHRDFAVFVTLYRLWYWKDTRQEGKWIAACRSSVVDDNLNLEESDTFSKASKISFRTIPKRFDFMRRRWFLYTGSFRPTRLCYYTARLQCSNCSPGKQLNVRMSILKWKRSVE